MTPLTVPFTSSGSMRYLKLDGRDYNLSSIRCACVTSTVTVDVTTVQPNGTIPATIHCDQHGEIDASARRFGLPFETPEISARANACFAPMAERFNNDKRNQWGKVSNDRRTA